MRHEARISVRSSVPADDVFIRDLGRSAFGEYSPSAGRATAEMAARSRTLVACEGGRPIGFAVVEAPHSGVCHLSTIAVLEEERGRGVGRALLTAAEKNARSMGARVLELTTADSNLSALDLFLHRGFQAVRRTVRYYARGQDALLLQKSL